MTAAVLITAAVFYCRKNENPTKVKLPLLSEIIQLRY